MFGTTERLPSIGALLRGHPDPGSLQESFHVYQHSSRSSSPDSDNSSLTSSRDQWLFPPSRPGTSSSRSSRTCPRDISLHNSKYKVEKTHSHANRPCTPATLRRAQRVREWGSRNIDNWIEQAAPAGVHTVLATVRFPYREDPNKPGTFKADTPDHSTTEMRRRKYANGPERATRSVLELTEHQIQTEGYITDLSETSCSSATNDNKLSSNQLLEFQTRAIMAAVILLKEGGRMDDLRRLMRSEQISRQFEEFLAEALREDPYSRKVWAKAHPEDQAAIEAAGLMETLEQEAAREAHKKKKTPCAQKKNKRDSKL